jgi:hypothetical protein
MCSASQISSDVWVRLLEIRAFPARVWDVGRRRKPARTVAQQHGCAIAIDIRDGEVQVHMKSPYSSSASLTSTDTTACKNLSFDKVPHDAF